MSALALSLLAIISLLSTVYGLNAQARLPPCSLTAGKLWDRCIGTIDVGDERYTGEFRDGERSGYGQLIRKGERYFGEFKNGKPDGKGRLFSGSGDLVKEGFWRDGALAVTMPVPGRPEINNLSGGASQQGGTIALRFTPSGTYSLKLTINGALTLDAMLDTGASSVVVPADVVSTLKRTGALRNEDFRGQGDAILADGSRSKVERFVIRNLTIGSVMAKDVLASSTSHAGGLLLGQSFLSRFDTWTVDNKKGLLILE